MSRPIMADDGIHVKSRNGEFYHVSSTYALPNQPGMKRTPWKSLSTDLDELQNKPRRFFDKLLSIVETQRDADPLIDHGNHKEMWDYYIRGIEMWSSAVDAGLYSEVIRLAQPLDEEGKKLREEFMQDYTHEPPYWEES